MHESARVRITSWDVAKDARPADPVSAVWMRDSLINQFVLDDATTSGTSSAVTMPTKPFSRTREGVPPFAGPFGPGGALEPLGSNHWGFATWCVRSEAAVLSLFAAFFALTALIAHRSRWQGARAAVNSHPSGRRSAARTRDGCPRQ